MNTRIIVCNQLNINQMPCPPNKSLFSHDDDICTSSSHAIDIC
jgi:hypothetical protein